MNWLGFKHDLQGLTGLDKDALHIYAAVGIQMLVAFLTRRGFRSWLPWLAVAAVALANEWADMYFECWPDRVLQASYSLHDIVNTMIMPTFLLVFAHILAPRSEPITVEPEPG